MNKLRIAVEMARTTTGDVYKVGKLESDKYQFKRFATGTLRAIAIGLGLPKESYDVRFNAGGPAVSGEATLHHDSFYVQISQTGVMFRTCKGRKDYTGGPNRWAWGYGGGLDQDMLEAKLREMIEVNPSLIPS